MLTVKDEGRISVEPGETPEGLVQGVETVGALLARTRESYGQDIGEVADTLRIRKAHLQAIEDERYDALPGTTYAIGFVRSYADYLRLDSSEVVDRFKAEVSGLQRATDLVFPMPKPEARVPGGALVVLSILLVALAYGAWAFFSKEERSLADLVPAVPEALRDFTSEDEALETSLEQPSPAQDLGSTAEPKPEPASGPAPGSSVAEDVGPVADPVVPLTEVEVATAPLGGEDTAGGPQATGQTTPLADDVGEALSEGAVDIGTAETALDGGAASQGPSPADALAAQEVETRPLPPSQAAIPSSPPVNVGPTALPATSLSLAPLRTAARQTAARVEAAEATARPLPDAPTVSAQESDDIGFGGPGDEGITATEPVEARSSVIPAAPGSASPPAEVTGEGGRVFGAQDGPSRVVVEVIADSWVQVRDASGELLLTQVLQRGDTYRAPDEEGLSLLTGNAGGLNIFVDGKLMPSLGPSGAVRRDIPLDPDLLVAEAAGG
jgi:cytoskeletal protein RodZ